MEEEEDTVSSDPSPEELPMPAQPTPQPPAPASAHQRSKPPSGASPSPDPDAAPRKPAEEGAIFHALLNAGADPAVAYTAAKRVDRMVSESAATQSQRLLVEVRGWFAALEQRLAVLEQHLAVLEQRLAAVELRLDSVEQRLDSVERRLDSAERRLDEHDRKLDALLAAVQKTNEIMTVNFDALRRELRLIWGALGVILTMWLAVFGWLLAN